MPSGSLLLYASNVAGGQVDAYLYPRGKLVGQLTGFGFPMGMCSDGSGNVYVVDYFGGSAYEIQHGTTTVVNSSKQLGGSPSGCSVSTNGDLAVTVSSGYSINAGWVTGSLAAE